MAAVNREYTLDWNDHADNLSIAFNDLLEQKELVDVTLVADGYLFNAHRLVLAALSPHFREMFTQMPAHQQAFVFMKDVSKQTLQHLMTFMYRGEVNVNHGNLEEFFSIAKALRIKGLTDESYSFALQSKTSTPVHNGSQYQSSHTIHVQRPVNEKPYSDAAQSNYYYQQQSANEFEQPTAFEYDGADSMNRNENENGYEIQKNCNDDICDDYCTGNDGSLMGETVAKASTSRTKRNKRNYNADEYNIVADIRKNEFGRENLHHNGHKLYRHTNGIKKQQWYCTKRTAEKCGAAISTMDINGVVMIKVLHADHNHEP